MKQTTMTQQMDPDRSTAPLLPELPAGCKPLVDGSSGRTVYLNAATKDLIFDLTEVFRVAAREKLTREVGQFGPTPRVPVATSAPGCTQHCDDEDSSIVIATVYTGSPERPRKRCASQRKRSSRKKWARSTVSLSTEPNGPNSIPGSVYVTPDMDRTKNATRYTQEMDYVRVDHVERYNEQNEPENVNDEDGQDDSIATTDLPMMENFISFKLPTPDPLPTESESDDSFGPPSKNPLNGEYDDG